MRKYIYAIALAALLLTACQKSDGIVEKTGIRENVLTARLESGDTRTELGKLTAGGYKNLWSEGDVIGIYIDDITTPAEYTLTGGVGTSEAKFTGYGLGYNYIAVYPFSMAAGIDGSVVELNLPAEQHYVPDSFGADSYPMVAVSKSTQLQFRNLCAVLKVSLTGEDVVRSIVFTANDSSVFVAGRATVDCSRQEVPELKMGSEGVNEVTLVCGDVRLDSEMPTDFHIVLPAQQYTGGFTLTINTVNDSLVKSTEESVLMERSQLRAIPAFCTNQPEIPTRTLRVTHNSREFAVPYIMGEDVEGSVWWGDGTPGVNYVNTLVYHYMRSGTYEVTVTTQNGSGFEMKNIKGVMKIDLSEF